MHLRFVLHLATLVLLCEQAIGETLLRCVATRFGSAEDRPVESHCCASELLFQGGVLDSEAIQFGTCGTALGFFSSERRAKVAALLFEFGLLLRRSRTFVG